MQSKKQAFTEDLIKHCSSHKLRFLHSRNYGDFIPPSLKLKHSSTPSQPPLGDKKLIKYWPLFANFHFTQPEILMFDFLIDDGRRIEMLDCIFKTTQHPIKSHSTADITMLKLNLTTRVFKLSQNRWKCVEGRGQKRWNTWDYVTNVNVIFFAHARIIIIIIHRDHCELCSSHNSKEFHNHSSPWRRNNNTTVADRHRFMSTKDPSRRGPFISHKLTNHRLRQIIDFFVCSWS